MRQQEGKEPSLPPYNSPDLLQELIRLQACLTELDSKLKTLPDELYVKFQEALPVASEMISDKVALKVVGESYYKWNSVSSFYPTVTFIFRQVQVTSRPKRTQVKTRYNARSQDFTEEMLSEVRQKAEALAGLRYNHGLIRGNYVSSDKRFKTTVYGETREEIKTLYDALLPVISEPFEPNNLSYTSGPRRVSITRRSVPLANIPAQYDEYNMVFTAEIYRVVLLINGLESPIVLWSMP